MLELYNQKPINIFILDNDKRVNIQFYNIKMKMKPCQFKLFNNYLKKLSSEINEFTENIDLLLVKDGLTITLSLHHFLLLQKGIQTVIKNKFYHKAILLN
tara:strand:- start:48 stop:347 length:300 start_codon:yes stop_codon:yes gene_type:complete